MNTQMTTQRLILRKFTDSDIPAAYTIFSDQNISTFLPWYPVKSLQETEKFLKERFQSRYAFAICLKSDNIPIGYIQMDSEEPYDFGYGLLPAFHHQGITGEAGTALIERLKKDGIPYITATHDRNNPASGNVMKRLGMIYRYSYHEQWQPKNIPVVFRMYQLNLDGKDQTCMKYWNMYEHFIEEDV